MDSRVFRVQLRPARPGARSAQPAGTGRARAGLHPPRIGRPDRTPCRRIGAARHGSQDRPQPVQSRSRHRRRRGAPAGAVQHGDRTRPGSARQPREAVLLHHGRRLQRARDRDQRVRPGAGRAGVDHRRPGHRAGPAAGRTGARRLPVLRLSAGVRSGRRAAGGEETGHARVRSAGAQRAAMTRRPVNLPADAEARAAIATALDDTLIVEAAAGTGKTTEMVTRIVRTVATGRATMDEIVAVTFTEKAAGELKLRLREALEADAERSRSAEERPAADGSDRTRTNREAERGRLEEALKTLEEAHVNTIHGFCAELLRERPVEARVDPLFDVLTDIQAARLYERAFNGWLQTALADPPEGIRRALRRTSGPWVGGFDAGPIDRLRDAGRTLAELRDFAHPWSRRPFDRTGRLDALIEKLHALTALSCAGPASDNLYKSLDGVRRLSRQIQLEQSLGQRDLDGWESRLIDLAHDHGLAKTRKGYGARYGNASRTQALAARDEFYAGLLQFRADADADLAATLQQELAPTIACYQVLKDQIGRAHV